MSSFETPVRNYARGIGDAVANRTINRKKPDGSTETWTQVTKRVALGNALLDPRPAFEEGGQKLSTISGYPLTAPQTAEFHRMNHHLRQASLLMSGRHLQHGDADQPNRNMEVFTNCSTSANSFLLFYLLLNGSGVGRAYDDAMIVADFNNMPIVVPVIDHNHADVRSGDIVALTKEQALHLYRGRRYCYFNVPDSREGWAKALEKLEVMAFRGERDTVLLLDFSDVRPKGSPIKGMQNRPSSGPGPLMVAINNCAKLREAGMKPWRAALYADHYLAECVLVGGARRAARMATKTWRDPDVLEFVGVKRGNFLWTANNSVTVDAEFWSYVKGEFTEECGPLGEHARAVFNAICEAAYHDQTGEPGFINQDMLVQKDEGLEVFDDGDFIRSAKYKLEPETLELTKAILARFKEQSLKMIVNPCGEIALSMLGGYCVIADVVPYHAGKARNSLPGATLSAAGYKEWDDDAEEAFRVATRALIRTNLMDSLYKKEVARTNRIGVGMTGVHEYAWARFGYTFKDLIDEEKSKDFWFMLSRFKNAVRQEAYSYSQELGVVTPHTDTTIKPAGTTSKLFGLTEGAHLPSMREYLRWVQFRNDDPLVAVYEKKGYPVRRLRIYEGTTIVGFPTKPEICQIMPGDKIVTAAEATPAEQYQWLRLLEKYWIVGPFDHDDSGNQVSYTLKYKPELVSFEEFRAAMMVDQASVRCCSVMPQGDTSAYEYLPEEAVTKHEFERIVEAIHDTNVKEEISIEHVDCSSGACPIDFKGQDDAQLAPQVSA